MHEGEVNTDATLVRRLLAAQFPHWADLPINPVPSSGTDNALYRLGRGMIVRLPRIDWAVGQIDKDCQWLPKFVPCLPLKIPVPLAKGEPGEGYPWHWGIYRWLEGENLSLENIADPCQAAIDLAEFILALRKIDPTGGPLARKHQLRGAPLEMRDDQTRQAITSLDGIFDPREVTAAWEEALRTPVWNRKPVWCHGDLLPGNLLFEEGRLRAVIDFSGVGVGDPACDLIPAWCFFAGKSRETFRNALVVDEASWARGQGWALSIGLIALPYYVNTNPVLAQVARYAIEQVLADHRKAG